MDSRIMLAVVGREAVDLAQLVELLVFRDQLLYGVKELLLVSAMFFGDSYGIGCPQLQTLVTLLTLASPEFGDIEMPLHALGESNVF